MATNITTHDEFQSHPGIRQDLYDAIPYVAGNQTGGAYRVTFCHVAGRRNQHL